MQRRFPSRHSRKGTGYSNRNVSSGSTQEQTSRHEQASQEQAEKKQNNLKSLMEAWLSSETHSITGDDNITETETSKEDAKSDTACFQFHEDFPSLSRTSEERNIKAEIDLHELPCLGAVPKKDGYGKNRKLVNVSRKGEHKAEGIILTTRRRATEPGIETMLWNKEWQPTDDGSKNDDDVPLLSESAQYEKAKQTTCKSSICKETAKCDQEKTADGVRKLFSTPHNQITRPSSSSFDKSYHKNHKYANKTRPQHNARYQNKPFNTRWNPSSPSKGTLLSDHVDWKAINMVPPSEEKLKHEKHHQMRTQRGSTVDNTYAKDAKKEKQKVAHLPKIKSELLNIEKLKELKDHDANFILFTLTQENNGFIRILNEEDHNPTDACMIMALITKACSNSTQSQSVLKLLVDVERSIFCTVTLQAVLTVMVSASSSHTKEMIQQFFEDILDFLMELTSRMPHSITLVIGIITFIRMSLASLSQEEMILSDIIDVKMKHLDMINTSILKKMESDGLKANKVLNSSASPPNDFRTISVMPRYDDIYPTTQPFLREIKTTGGYSSLDDYLDVQFRLLREDFVQPLREGITKYLMAAGNPKLHLSVRIYHDVVVLGSKFNRDKFVRTVTFDTSSLKEVEWKHSKRLMYGTLVCLTNDNFRTFSIATVESGPKLRDEEDSNSEVTVELFIEHIVGEREININLPMVMVETSAYFEAYRYVLASLQNIKEGRLAFEDYIVHCKTDVKPPAYLRDKPNVKYDFGLLKQNSGRVTNAERVIQTLFTATKSKADPGDGLKIDDLFGLDDSTSNDTIEDIFDDRNGTIDDDGDDAFVTNNINDFDDANVSNDANVRNFADVSFQSGNEYETEQRTQDKTENEVLIEDGNTGEENESILDLNKWPKPEELHLDAIQFEAFQQALTKEFVIMQGPPGTGKTYVGLKIAKTLLRNAHVWKQNNPRPMLIVCYTNHALDQFLEGILSFYKGSLVRVGSRCNSEIVKPYGISEMRKLEVFDKLYEELGLEYVVCQNSLLQTQEHIRSLHNGIVNYSELAMFVRLSHRHQLTLSGISPDEALFDWLDLLEFELVDEEEYSESAGEISQDKLNENNHGKSDSIPSKENEKISKHDGVIKDVDVAVTERKLNVLDTVPSTDEDGDSLLSEPSEKDIHKHETILEGKAAVGKVENKVNDAVNSVPSQENKNGVDKNETLLEENEALIVEMERKLDDADDFEEQFRVLQMRNVNKLSPHFKRFRRRLSRKKRHKLLQKIGSSSTMTREEETNVDDIWSLQNEDRWRLYKLWVLKLQEQLETEMVTKQQACVEANEEYRVAKLETDKKIMKKCSVIGMTTSGAARYQKVLSKIKPRIIIIEEAAEVLEGHVIASLSSDCQHLIMIGDHQQLRPSTNVYVLAKRYNLELSLFERMVKNGLQSICLEKQHRMRPSISRIMKHIYPNLRDDASVQDFQDILGVCSNVFFINHSVDEQKNKELISHLNVFEAEYVIALCLYFIKQGYTPNRITILTTYSAQVAYLKQHMSKETFEGVRVTSVDNYQGEENDIILLSLVRSNLEGNVGFLKIDNRVCVALSRAKKGLYVIGNFELLSNQSSLWKTIVDDLKSEGQFGPALELYCQNHPKDSGIKASKPKDFSLAPDGGCMKHCLFRLDCGHVCAKKCHPVDPHHLEYKCEKPCQKTIPSCGHKQQVPCWKDPDHFECMHPVIRKGKCGHEDKVPCSMRDAPCMAKCDTVLKCGHICSGLCLECIQGRLHVPCKETCNKILICGHECLSVCSTCPLCLFPCENRCDHGRCDKQCAEPCTPCNDLCTWKCKDTKCTKRCSELCNRLPCNKKCPRMLKCGHRCIGLCGEKCPILCSKCNKDEVQIFLPEGNNPGALFVELEDCGHIVEVGDLDKLMADSLASNKIQLSQCPWCQTYIRHNNRYGDTIKQLWTDIDAVKKEIKAEQDIWKTKTNPNSPEYKKNISENYKIESMYCLAVQSLEGRVAVQNQITVLKSLSTVTGYMCCCSDCCQFQDDCDIFKTWIKEKRQVFTEQDAHDAENELKRLRLFIDVHDFKELVRMNRKPLSEEQKSNLDLVKEYILDGNPYTQERQQKVTAALSELAVIFQLSKERIQTMPSLQKQEKEFTFSMPMTFAEGHWFKCKDGHTYHVNGGSDEARCPKCAAKLEENSTAHDNSSIVTLNDNDSYLNEKEKSAERTEQDVKPM